MINYQILKILYIQKLDFDHSITMKQKKNTGKSSSVEQKHSRMKINKSQQTKNNKNNQQANVNQRFIDLLQPKQKQNKLNLAASDQKILQQEFEKMVRKVKAKIKTKNCEKSDRSEENSNLVKTKPFQFFDNSHNSQTFRNLVFDEKICKTSCNGVASERIKLHSPKNSKRSLKYEKKKKKIPDHKSLTESLSPIKGHYKKKKEAIQPIKSDRKTRINIYCNNNYYMFGENFIAINEQQTKQLKQQQEQLLIQSLQNKQNYYNKSQQSHLSNQTDLKSPSELVQGDQISNQYHNREQNANLLVLDNINNSNFCKNQRNDLSLQKERQYLQIFSNYEDLVEAVEGEDGRALSSIQCSPTSNKSQQKNIAVPNNSSGIISLEQEENVQNHVDSIQEKQNLLNVRVRVIDIQMKTNCQILNKLLKTQKITQQQYQGYLDNVMQTYDHELTDAENLKFLMTQNQTKIGQIIIKTQHAVKYMEQIENKNNQKQVILSKMFGLPENINERNILYDRAREEERKKQENMLYFCDLKETELNHEIQLQQENKQISIGISIDERVSFQMGLIKAQTNLPVNTSVLGIFHVLKNFYRYLLHSHRDQLIKYLNMPYGYSIQQRLMYMQGYDSLDDDIEDNLGVIYGIQEVLSPEIFLQYSIGLYQSQNMKKSPENIEYQKIHNRAIFDGINQALNEYRPYYLLNGPPYSWTFSEKTLTFFFISEENVEEVLQKVQLQILKWSSSLCGLIILEDFTNPSSSPQIIDQNPLEIGEIFQRYSASVDQKLMETRQQRALKIESAQIQQKSFEWENFEEQKTAVMFQLTSIILEEISTEIAIFMCQKVLN